MSHPCVLHMPKPGIAGSMGVLRSLGTVISIYRSSEGKFNDVIIYLAGLHR